jgi:hypothetical protein
MYTVTYAGFLFVERSWMWFHVLRHLVLVQNFYVPCPVLDIYNVSGSCGVVPGCAFRAKPKASNVLCLSLFPLPVCMMINCFILCIVIQFLCLMVLLDPCTKDCSNHSFRCEKLYSILPCLLVCRSLLNWPCPNWRSCCLSFPWDRPCLD